MAAIGIDLGTSNCCIAFSKNGLVDIITNTRNGRTTPSSIGFSDTNKCVGEDADAIALKNEQNFITGVKYMIGRTFDDPVVQKRLKYWTFNVVNEDNKIKIAAKINGNTKYFVPEELSAILLKNLKKHAEIRLDCEIKNVVITVPTYFSDPQRQATKDAGAIAGFVNIKLINESVAAAIAYGSEKSFDVDRHIFIFDFGGGTFDVSIIKCKKNKYEVIAIDGDLELGGDDITNNLINYLLKNNVIKKRNLHRLRKSCEAAKINLSFHFEAHVELPWDDDGIDIKRNQFEALNKNIFDKIMQITKKCVEKSKLKIDEIDDILLIGGSSSIPGIKTQIQQYFGKYPKSDITPDEAVAKGAAIFASNWKIEPKPIITLPKPLVKETVLTKPIVTQNKPINSQQLSPKPSTSRPYSMHFPVQTKTELVVPKPLSTKSVTEPKPIVSTSRPYSMHFPIKQTKPEVNQIQLNTLCAHSIGIELMGKNMHIVIAKNSKLPAVKTQKGLYAVNGRNDVNLKIFSGENKLTKNNSFLGDLHINYIAMAKDGIRKYEVTFELDTDGILKVTAKDTSGNINNLKITLGKNNLSTDEIDKYKKRL